MRFERLVFKQSVRKVFGPNVLQPEFNPMPVQKEYWREQRFIDFIPVIEFLCHAVSYLFVTIGRCAPGVSGVEVSARSTCSNGRHRRGVMALCASSSCSYREGIPVAYPSKSLGRSHLLPAGKRHHPRATCALQAILFLSAHALSSRPASDSGSGRPSSRAKRSRAGCSYTQAVSSVSHPSGNALRIILTLGVGRRRPYPVGKRHARETAHHRAAADPTGRRHFTHTIRNDGRSS
jgi:hypothetical protein